MYPLHILVTVIFYPFLNSERYYELRKTNRERTSRILKWKNTSSFLAPWMLEMETIWVITVMVTIMTTGMLLYHSALCWISSSSNRALFYSVSPTGTFNDSGGFLGGVRQSQTTQPLGLSPQKEKKSSIWKSVTGVWKYFNCYSFNCSSFLWTGSLSGF